LSGANVLISAGSFTKGTVSDASGTFHLDSIPVGRYKIQISFTGFTTYVDELLIIAAKTINLDVTLEETSLVLSEITLVDQRSREYDPSLTSISIEKTMRIPANFFDPVRMTTSYPGVVAANDQANAIIVKGNSPNGLLWRLNGIDIVNPNHLANAGTISDKPMSSGGGVNILSAQMLDKTDFHTGAFPIHYGNALAGVLDMNLRSGNKHKDEYTVQASLLGIDLSAEGPFKKTGNNSYLLNYRYSTVGLLSKMGVQFGDEEISFQDLSFHTEFDLKNGASIGVFGMGGRSNNDFSAKEPDEVEIDKDNYNINYEATTYALGINLNQPLKNGNIFFGAGYSSSQQERYCRLYNFHPEFDQLRIDNMLHKKELLSTHLSARFKMSSALSIVSGVLANQQIDDLRNGPIFKFGQATFPNQGLIEGWIVQPYINSQLTLSPSVSANAGIRYFRFTFNDTDAWEPRLSLHLSLSGKHQLSLAYRLSSQIQHPALYIYSMQPDIELTKSHHLEAGLQSRLNETTTLKTELYYQSLFDVPVGVNVPFSAINMAEIAGFVLPQTNPGILENSGKGKNYGINITAEKSFFGNHYFILGGSLYKSTYTTRDEKEYQSRFDGRYMFTGTYGKEWRKMEKKRTIGLNTRLLYIGGTREPFPITGTGMAGEPLYDPYDTFSRKLKDYYRVDLRVSFRKDKPGYTRTFAIDIQNLTGAQNEAYHYFDAMKGTVETKYQLGIIPVLVYRIDF
jgi:hypothetical protein